MTPLLTTLLPLVALLGSASAGTNKWTLSALNCRGTTGQDPPKAENSPIWLPAERSCTILKRSLDSPFLDGETSYHSICCKAFVPSPRLHPSQLHSMCVYSPAYISNIRDEKSCFSGGLDVQGCVSVSISPEPYRETITPEMPECDNAPNPTLFTPCWNGATLCQRCQLQSGYQGWCHHVHDKAGLFCIESQGCTNK